MKELAVQLSRLDVNFVSKSFYYCLAYALEALALMDI